MIPKALGYINGAHRMIRLSFAIIESEQKTVDVSAAASHSAANAIRVADGCRASHRPVTHRDLLFEILALRHQLGVLSRSHRRVRTSDRLFWLRADPILSGSVSISDASCHSVGNFSRGSRLARRS